MLGFATHSSLSCPAFLPSRLYVLRVFVYFLLLKNNFLGPILKPVILEFTVPIFATFLSFVDVW